MIRIVPRRAALPLIALLALPGLARAQTPGSPAPGILITRAFYGPQTAAASCPALTLVRTACQGQIRCSVSTAQNVCDYGEKTAPALFLSLTVSYRCSDGGVTRQAVVEHPFVLRISCAAAK